MPLAPSKEDQYTALESQINEEPELYYKGVLYGDFGKRKTSTSTRCSQKGKRAVLLHADRGWHVYRKHDELRDKVIPVEYEGLSQIRALVDAIVDGAGKFTDVDLLILDTVSQMQENFIDFLMLNTNYGGKYRDQLVQTAKSKANGIKFDPLDVPAPVDYHVVRNQMRPVFEHCVKAPIDVIFTSHVKEPSPISTQPQIRRPNITEATYNVLARDATFIGYMNDQGGKHTINFKGNPRMSAKSQIKALDNQDKLPVDELPQILWDWKKNGI